MKYNLICSYILEFGVKILFAKRPLPLKKRSKDQQPIEWSPYSSAPRCKKKSKASEARRTWGLILGPSLLVQFGKASVILSLSFLTGKTILKVLNTSQLADSHGPVSSHGLPGRRVTWLGLPLQQGCSRHTLHPPRLLTALALAKMVLSLSGTSFWMFCIWSTFAHPWRFGSLTSLKGLPRFPQERMYCVLYTFPTHLCSFKKDLRQS